MSRAFRFVLFLCGLSVAPHFVFAAVVINEVLFDPSGADTGLEKIELYNPDASPADLSNWELYPDGVGYFVFPGGFSLSAKSFLSIHLRTTGANNATNLYHSGASANLGNSSGSAALFKPGGRTKDTVADFIRYHKPGAAEKKTWESTAVEAGLWSVGTFVDISALGEGSAIGLAADGARGNAASWSIFASSSIGGLNAATPTPTPSPAATSSPPVSSQTSSGPPPVPSLKASAGTAVSALAGATVVFRGMAFGLNGELLPDARFLWVFGDGSTQEGKAIIHIYHFPGVYRANLLVSSGEYTGSDWRVVTVLPPELKIAEVKPASEGFVEVFNASDEDVDLGGMSLTDDKKTVFRLPRGTTAGGKSAIVFPNIITGLNPEAFLFLHDARGSSLDEASFSGVVPKEGSWERTGNGFVVRPRATPGTFVAVANEETEKAVVAAPAAVSSAPLVAKTSSPGGARANSASGNPGGFSENATSSEVLLLPSPRETTNAKPAAAVSSRVSTRFFFAASVITSLVAAAAFLLLKRNVL